MKRLIAKLAAEARAIASEIAVQVSAIPDDRVAASKAAGRAELVLRDAVANLRLARNRLSFELGNSPEGFPP